MFEQSSGVVEPSLPAAAQERLAAARAALREVEQRLGTTKEALDVPTLPLASGLREVLPQGLRRGQVLAVEGSTSLALAIAGQACTEGSWAAAIGMPHLGLLAARQRGIDLDRLAVIPHPGMHAAAVVAACLEGMDIVMLGPALALSDADRRRLASRARERGAVLLVQGSWAGAQVTLTVKNSRWSGLGAGEGRLRERLVTVEVTGRSMGASRTVALPLDSSPQSHLSVGGARTVGQSLEADLA